MTDVSQDDSDIEDEESDDVEGEEQEDQEDGDEEEQEEQGEDDIKIPARSSPQYNSQQVIARQKRTIEKLRTGDKPAKQEQSDGEEDMSAKIAQAVQEHLKPILDSHRQTLNGVELDSLVRQNPEAKKYEKTIRAYMDHDAYRDVPAEVIYHHLAWQEAQKKGAKLAKQADDDAKKTRTGGNVRRPSERSKRSTPATFDELQNMEERMSRGEEVLL